MSKTQTQKTSKGGLDLSQFAPLPAAQRSSADSNVNVLAPKVQPLLHQILVRMMEPRSTKELAGGGTIYLPDEVRDKNEHLMQVGKIVAIGEGAFKDRDSGKDWASKPELAVGDLVLVAQYSGSYVIIDNVKHRILDDDTLLARVDDPDMIKAYV